MILVQMKSITDLHNLVLPDKFVTSKSIITHNIVMPSKEACSIKKKKRNYGEIPIIYRKQSGRSEKESLEEYIICTHPYLPKYVSYKFLSHSRKKHKNIQIKLIIYPLKFRSVRFSVPSTPIVSPPVDLQLCSIHRCHLL